MKDPLLSKIRLKTLDEIIAAAKDTIRRHRRRFLQRSLRPCPHNCKDADMVGHKVVGCTGCGSTNSDLCIKSGKFEPMFTKEELAQQFADQLRNPEVLLREYRDVTVFLWVLGAFDKQNKVIDETIVSKVEQRDSKASVRVDSSDADGSDRNPETDDSTPTGGAGGPVANPGNRSA